MPPKKTSSSNFDELLAIGSAVIAGILFFGLFGCAEHPVMPTGAAGALSGEGFSLLSDYSPVVERLTDGLDQVAVASSGENDNTRTAAISGSEASSPDIQTAEETAEDGSYQPSPKTGETVAINRDSVAGLNKFQMTVAGTAGFTYIVKGEYLSVMDENGAKHQEINLYDCVVLSGQALAVIYEPESQTLAVLYAANAAVWRDHPDLAIAAWAAPKTLLLFFDAQKPANLVFLDAQGITGTPKAICSTNNLLVIATEHDCLPSIDSQGEWETAELTPVLLDSYKTSLQLRAGDPLAFAPSFFRDGELYPLLPEQLYLSPWGNCTKTTVVAVFSLGEQKSSSLCAFYDPGMKSAGEEAVINDTDITFNYRVEYQGALARLSVMMNTGANGNIGGIYKTSWSRL